jgi:hypothetical protein
MGVAAIAALLQASSMTKQYRETQNRLDCFSIQTPTRQGHKAAYLSSKHQPPAHQSGSDALFNSKLPNLSGLPLIDLETAAHQRLTA